MAYSIELTNKNGKKFRFHEGEVGQATYSRQTRLLKQSLPDSEADEAIVINLGTEKSINFPILLRTGTDDASVGTHSSTVTTTQEKLDYLDEVFLTSGTEDFYTIIINSTAANLASKKGIIENFQIDFMAEKPKSLSGNISLSLGGGNQS